MNIFIAILLAADNEVGGTVQGRTLLQKKLYFLSTMMKQDFGYKPHYYGPYSGEVAEAVDSLVSSGFLTEQRDVFPSSNYFCEVRRYAYTITADGKKLLKSAQQNRGFEQWLQAMKKINCCDMSSDFSIISLAAKMHYIVAEEGKASSEEIREIGGKLGWKISDDDIEKVAAELERLGLISEVEE